MTSKQTGDDEKRFYCSVSKNRITNAGYRDTGEVDLRFKQRDRESKRKSLFVSMNTQAINASIIQAACREKPSHAVQPRFFPRLLMLFRQQRNNGNAAELFQTKLRETTCCKITDKTDQTGIDSSIFSPSKCRGAASVPSEDKWQLHPLNTKVREMRDEKHIDLSSLFKSAKILVKNKNVQ